MRKLDEVSFLLGQDDHRYPYSYRIYTNSLNLPLKKGDFFKVEWHSIDFGKGALAIFHKVESGTPGANKVDGKGRLNFTPPQWIFPDEIRPEKPVNYGNYSKGEFEFEEQ